MPKSKTRTEAVVSEREQLVDTFVRCFETAEGQLVLAYLKSRYQDKSSVFGFTNGGLLDTTRTFVAEGGRLVYLHIKELIQEGLDARAGKFNTDNLDPDAIPDSPSIWDL